MNRKLVTWEAKERQALEDQEEQIKRRKNLKTGVQSLLKMIYLSTGKASRKIKCKRNSKDEVLLNIKRCYK